MNSFVFEFLAVSSCLAISGETKMLRALFHRFLKALLCSRGIEKRLKKEKR